MCVRASPISFPRTCKNELMMTRPPSQRERHVVSLFDGARLFGAVNTKMDKELHGDPFYRSTSTYDTSEGRSVNAKKKSHAGVFQTSQGNFNTCLRRQQLLKHPQKRVTKVAFFSRQIIRQKPGENIIDIRWDKKTLTTACILRIPSFRTPVSDTRKGRRITHSSERC